MSEIGYVVIWLWGNGNPICYGPFKTRTKAQDFADSIGSESCKVRTILKPGETSPEDSCP